MIFLFFHYDKRLFLPSLKKKKINKKKKNKIIINKKKIIINKIYIIYMLGV